MRFILRSKKKSRKITNANKITIGEKKAKDNAKETRETKIETKRTKASAKANVEATTTTTTIATTTKNKKQLSKLHKQFVCTYVSFVLETTLKLLSYLLLFDNLRECANNTLQLKVN